MTGAGLRSESTTFQALGICQLPGLKVWPFRKPIETLGTDTRLTHPLSTKVEAPRRKAARLPRRFACLVSLHDWREGTSTNTDKTPKPNAHTSPCGLILRRRTTVLLCFLHLCVHPDKSEPGSLDVTLGLAQGEASRQNNGGLVGCPSRLLNQNTLNGHTHTPNRCPSNGTNF